MQAAVLREFGKPLVLEEVETPTPGPGEVLVQVMACGIDGTDLKLLDGFGYAPKLPFIIGHEPAGVVDAVGAGVADFRPGDRVITYNFFTCGNCLLCRTHREQLCINMTGVLGAREKPGGYAEYLKMPARQLVPLPEHIPWPDAAVICDAGITALHAVERSRLMLGETVMVIGIGGVGSYVTQFAKLAGVRVIAVDQSDAKSCHASAMGADVAIDSCQVEVVKSVHELTDGLGADCVIDCVGKEQTITHGIDSLRHGGRLVIIGYTPDHYRLNGKRLAQNELEIIGTRCGRKQDLINAVRLVAQGKTKSIVTNLYPLEQANEALAFLRTGKVLGRLVLLTPMGRQAMQWAPAQARNNSAADSKGGL